MKRHISKPQIVITAMIALFLLVWGAALIKCEVLTNRYYDQFALAYQNNPMICDVEYFKVLRCDGETAEVYYISAECGDVLEFRNHNGTWEEASWRTIWSKHGSASKAVWPYWWQVFITGF